QVAVETYMGCGTGVCLGCAVPLGRGGYDRACTEGPVYRAADIDWLLADGHDVVGLDCFRDSYSRGLKEQNLAAARGSRGFSFCHLDLVEDDLSSVLDGAEVVYHLASRSGLGVSTGREFDQYIFDNVLATQRLLEALAGRPITRLVYAGSSSVYGDAEMLPTKESSVPRPLSTYGATKLAAENLVQLYGRNF